MYLDVSPALLLAYALLTPLALLLIAWFFVGGTADTVVERVAGLIVQSTRVLGRVAIRPSRQVIGGLMVKAGRRLIATEAPLTAEGAAE
jgi:hypothetical protein